MPQVSSSLHGDYVTSQQCGLDPTDGVGFLLRTVLVVSLGHVRVESPDVSVADLLRGRSFASGRLTWPTRGGHPLQDLPPRVSIPGRWGGVGAWVYGLLLSE